MNSNILFTDIVGYSKLTGQDQSLALELLNEHDKIIEPIISKYDGQIIKRIGDAIVAIFDNTKQMIQTSVEIQQSLKNRNNRNIKSRQLILRIGLHYGDIIIEGDEIYGEGYDLASEIEPICQFGSIAISDAVYQQVHQDDELIIHGINNYFFVNPIANFNFKAIPKPILIYKVYLNLLDWYDEPIINIENYLLDQHIPKSQYDIIRIPDIHSKKNTYYLDKANDYLSKYNLSHATYYYKRYLDICNFHDIKCELLILKIFSECGLVRLINNIIEQYDKKHNFYYLITGINAFNQKDFDTANTQLSQFLNSKDSEHIFDGLYYLITILCQKKQYDNALKLIDSYKKIIINDSIHSVIFDNIYSIVKKLSSQSNKKNYNTIINKTHKAINNMNLINLNNKRYILFIYYLLIQLIQKNGSSEIAIPIQNNSIKIIKELKNMISDYTLRNLFYKKPYLHQMIMEPLEIELEFVDHEGLDDYDFDDILTEQYNFDDSTNESNFQLCNKCNHQNSIKFNFCTSCGNKLSVSNEC